MFRVEAGAEDCRVTPEDPVPQWQKCVDAVVETMNRAALRAPVSPAPMRADLRERAEALWEELDGDLCICQDVDVPHWCEQCQQRINLIVTAFHRASSVTPTPETPEGWQSIETAPLEQRIIVCSRDWVGEVMVGSKDEWRKWQHPPTHWMPLPPAPAKTGDQA